MCSSYPSPCTPLSCPKQKHTLTSFARFSLQRQQDPEGSNETLVDWRGKVTLYFTWLFIGSRAIFFLFIVFIGFKFSHVKLGAKNEEPEFSTAAFFSMIFAAGVAVGLFVYGVSEPLWHQHSHWFAEAGYHSQDEIDMYAINLTVNNWAIAGWAPYLVVAICMGLAGHRFKLPLTFRSCLYPILQEYTWGWIGDVIDGFTIVVTGTSITRIVICQASIRMTAPVLTFHH
jgi:choline-glycine betaine transporter